MIQILKEILKIIDIVPPSGNAGLNGARHWGIHLLSASFPYFMMKILL